MQWRIPLPAQQIAKPLLNHTNPELLRPTISTQAKNNWCHPKCAYDWITPDAYNSSEPNQPTLNPNESTNLPTEDI